MHRGRRLWSVVAAGACGATVVVGSGCHDASIEVRLDVPAAWRSRVTSAALEVYAPAMSHGFGCDDLAHGELGADTLTAARVVEVVARAGSSIGLDGVPRVGDKRFVAHGFDRAGRELVTGCAERADLDDGAVVTLVAEPRLQLTIPGLRAILDEIPASVEAAVTDADGEPAAGVAVRWGVRTIEGSTGDQEVMTDGKGRAVIRTQPPDTPGPVAIDLGVRWQINPLPPVTSFVSPATVDAFTFDASPTLTDNDGLYQVGPVGPAGEPGYAILAPVGAGKSTVHVRYRDSAGGWHGVSSPSVPSGAIALVPRSIVGGERQAVVTVAGNQFVEVSPTTGALVDQGGAGAGLVASRFVEIGGCASGDAYRLLWTKADGTSATLSSKLVVVSDRPIAALLEARDRILGSGCVADAGGALHRTVAVVRGARVLVVSDLDGGRLGGWPAQPRGVGFTPASAAEHARLLGNEQSIDGVRITRSEVVSVGNALSTAVVGADDVASVALGIAGGHLNDDVAMGLSDQQRSDVAAVIVTGAGREGTTVRLYMAVSQEPSYGDLRGVSCEQTLIDPRVFLYDFDGDGRDEVLIGSLGSAAVLDLDQRGAACP